MSDCHKTTLPQETCAHCTGSRGLEVIDFFELDQNDVFRYTTLEEEQEMDLQEVLARKDESDASVNDIYRQEHPGRWARAEDVYGGGDNYADFERIDSDV